MSRLDTLSPSDRRTSGSDGPSHGRLREEPEEAPRHINVGETERQMSFLGGTALVGLGGLGLLRGRMSGLALAGVGLLLARRGYTGHCGLYEALDVDTRGDGGPEASELYERGVKIREAVTIGRPAQELYDHWHRFENHSEFMPNVESVRTEGERSFWRISGPGGSTWEYEAQIINDEPGRLIAWQSQGHADVQHAGSVRFIEAPAGRGTEVHFNVEYLPPAGVVGRFGAKLLGLIGQAPRNDVREGLRNFKRLMEAGELPTTDGQPRGRRC